MKRIVSATLLCVAWLFAPHVVAGQTVNFTASGIRVGGSLLASGQLCAVPVDAANHPFPNGALGGSSSGALTNQPACKTVTNGAIPTLPLPDTALTTPTNLCLRITIADATGAVRYANPCVQPASSGQAWCSTSGGVTTCNFDTYTPSIAPMSLATSAIDTTARTVAAAAQTSATAALPANGCTSATGGNIVCPGSVTVGTPVSDPTGQTMTIVGATGSAVYIYAIVARSGSTVSNPVFTASYTSASALNGTNHNDFGCASTAGIVYDVYRAYTGNATGAGATLGKIATGLSTCSVSDTGLTGDGTWPGAVSTSGGPALPSSLAAPGLLSVANVGAVRPGPFHAFMQSCVEGRSTAGQIVSDSTAADPWKWQFLLSRWLTWQFPTCAVRYRIFNDSTQTYDAPVLLSSGTLGERYLSFDGAGQSVYTYANTIPYDSTKAFGLRADIQPVAWTGATQVLFARWAGLGHQWQFYISTGGLLGYQWNNGTADITNQSTVALPTGNPRLKVRMTHVLDDGSGIAPPWYWTFDGAGHSITTTAASIPWTAASDYSIREYICPNSWTTTQSLFSRGTTGQWQVQLTLFSSGKLGIGASTTGASPTIQLSTVAAPTPTCQWVRGDHQLNDGAGHNVVTFYTSSDPASTASPTWTQLGTAVTVAGAISAINVPAALAYEAGGTSGSNLFTGKIYSIQVWQGGSQINSTDLTTWSASDSHEIMTGPTHNIVTFYTSLDGATWTQLGTPLTNTGVATVNYPSNTAILYEVGATSTSNRFNGKIYRIELWQGQASGSIPLAPINPLMLSLWQIGIGDTHETFGGSPTIDIYNASVAGQNIPYHQARLAAELWPAGQQFFILSDSHNELSTWGYTAWLANTVGAYLTSAKPYVPAGVVALLTQNPRTVTSTDNWYHDERLREIRAWGPANGYPLIDTQEAFFLDSRGLAALLEADGIHPNAKAGGPLQFSVVRDSFLQSR